ncbi:MAG TPA: energy transducer TonB [Steroidobacteraceae bacterium]|nr:energy transducer TonB [Steroidobacteraceae bacterium]
MAYYTQHNPEFFSRRALVFIISVAVQVALFVVFETGMASRVMNVVAPPIQTDIVQEVQKRDQPPPPPPPKMERPPVEVPPPDVAINVPTESNTTAITVVRKPKPQVYAPAPRRVVVVGASLDLKGSGSTDDYYPDVSRRLDETGTALVHACAGTNGRVSQTPTIERSSGSSRLDQAAIRYATHARYHPATEDGRAIPGCTRFNVTFRLTD